MNTQESPSAPLWHALPTVQVAQRLNTSTANGLTASEAATRLTIHGPNRLADKPPRPAWLKFFDQFKSLLVIILLGAAVLAGAIGDLKDAIVIAVLLLTPLVTATMTLAAGLLAETKGSPLEWAKLIGNREYRQGVTLP